VKDPGPTGKRARNRDPREAVQLVVLQLGKKWHPAEQIDGALLLYGHESDYGPSGRMGIAVDAWMCVDFRVSRQASASTIR
jgi:hypothetical protein